MEFVNIFVCASLTELNKSFFVPLYLYMCQDHPQAALYITLQVYN